MTMLMSTGRSILSRSQTVHFRRVVCVLTEPAGTRRLFTHQSDPMHRLFEDQSHAKDYAVYRPSFPQVTYETILNYWRQGGLPSNQLAVDIGCGTGTSTRPLVPHFDHVIGLDISQAQTDNARKDDTNVEYRVGPAEDLSFLRDDSVDLITCAQAFHWLNRERLYAEVTRVLRPRGAFIVYGYGECFVDRPDAQTLVSQFHHGLLWKEGWWDPERKMVDDCYRDVTLPIHDLTRHDDHVIEMTSDVDDFVSYVSTWSSWRKLLKAHPDATHLRNLRQRLSEIYSDPTSGQKAPVKVTWPVFILMGRK